MPTPLICSRSALPPLPGTAPSDLLRAFGSDPVSVWLLVAYRHPGRICLVDAIVPPWPEPAVSETESPWKAVVAACSLAALIVLLLMVS